MSFLNLLLQHLPVGPYSRDEDALHVRELQGVGTVLEDVDEDVGDLIDEIFPGSAVELLPDWERVFGIVPSSSATTAERQQAVLAAWAKQPSISVTYIEQAMETFTGVDVSINETDPPLYDSATYDESVFFDWTFQVLLDLVEAIAASIELAELEAAQAFLEEIQPGHTSGQVFVEGCEYDSTTTPYDWSVFGV